MGWPKPPTPETFLRLLRGSAHVWLAWEGNRVVGFITALSDGVMNASIPLLEVLPEFQGRGIGSELVRRVQGTLGDLYGLDLSCNDQMVPFYQRLGFSRGNGMFSRNRASPSLDGAP